MAERGKAIVPGADRHAAVFCNDLRIVLQWSKRLTQYIGGRIDIQPAGLGLQRCRQAVTRKANRNDWIIGKGEERDIAAESDESREGLQTKEGIQRKAAALVELLLILDVVGKNVSSQ